MKADTKHSTHIDALRHVMADEGIDLWYEGGSDPHLGEYIPDHWQTRTWLSGFTGSAGTLVVTQAFAGLWTDSRYFIQAEKELVGSPITLFRFGNPGIPSVEEFIMKNLPPKSVIGFNGTCLPAAKVQSWYNLFSEKDYVYKGDMDLVGRIWEERPSLPTHSAFRYMMDYAGEGSPQKINRIRKYLLEYHAEAILLTLLDEIAWVLNVRGRDVAYNPLVVSYLWLDRQRIIWFIDPQKMAGKLETELREEGVTFKHYNDVHKTLPELCSGQHVLIDTGRTSSYHEHLIRESAHKVIEGVSPATLFKSVKNPVEQDGIRSAHIRDGAAMVRWMVWLHQAVKRERHTEITVADQLQKFRAEQPLFRGLSFQTIAGYGEHGAIVHYSAKEETASVIKAKGILLVDSGGQYLDGTTDITRTIALSDPTSEQKKHFTWVLKGMINLSRAVFPEGTTGANLDVLARKFLWQEGLNYGHGTGHGVGCFLNVHEGPQRISLKSDVPLKAGMLMSNEPGIYFEGKYGIRIENLILCRESSKKGFLEFETVTLCPIDISMIESKYLTPEERQWLNTYHARVREKLSPLLTKTEQHWLNEHTREISG
jgi:Xaa-Pro aminopeptidase